MNTKFILRSIGNDLFRLADVALNNQSASGLLNDLQTSDPSGLYEIVQPNDFPKEWIHDCRLSYVSSSSVQIASGICRDFNDSFNIRLNENVSALITAAGAGGLDTGSETANTWYAVHIIADSTETNTPDALLSLSAHNPTLPSGYDKFRRVGWTRNDGSSNFLKFIQVWNGPIRRFGYDESFSTTRALLSGNANTFTGVDLSSLIPPTSNNVIFLSEFETNSTGATTHGLKIRPSGFSAAVSNVLWQNRIGVISTDKTRMQHEIPCIDQKIEYRVSNTNNSAHLSVAGFDDEL